MKHSKPKMAFKLCTFNMHGFAQGELILSHICNDLKFDILFIQEHWLTPDQLHSLCTISPNYVTVGISAMEETLSHSILYGRPYGGVSIFINNIYTNVLKIHASAERFVIITVCDIAFVNVYLPCYKTNIDCQIVADMLDEIKTILATIDYSFLVVGGDLNWDPKKLSPVSGVICSFMFEHCLILSDDLLDSLSNTVTHSYEHVTLKRFSYIDRFFISSPHSCYKSISLRPLIDYRNFSDHIPIVMSLNINVPQLLAAYIPPRQNVDNVDCAGIEKRCLLCHNWEHSNTCAYYEHTRITVEPMLQSLQEFILLCKKSETSYDNILTSINKFYTCLVGSLVYSSQLTVPIFKPQKNEKFWWDEEMQKLKQMSMDTHLKWVEGGKPRVGPLFDDRNRAKYKYRWKIRESKKSEKTHISLDLQDKLCNKNKTDFWKTWKSKFKNPTKITTIDGFTDDAQIAENFAINFHKICQPASEIKNNLFCNELKEKIISYKGASRDNINVDINTLSSIVDTMKIGKSPGSDGLTIEHFKYAHPCVLLFIKYLFELMLGEGCVPDDFGKGVTVPIPKDKNKIGSLSSDDFRAITINPIISKIFECCLLVEIQEYLQTDSRQFGFKKGIGCSKAIYVVKETVEYFTNNSSTVNLGCLDLSKAFDKVNHAGLFLKLMKRNIPIRIITLLNNWYSKASFQVDWHGILSNRYNLQCGLRQGSVLSPCLFSVYVDELLVILKKTRLGCFIKQKCLNSFMYADDIILLTISVTDMQNLVNVCLQCLSNLDLPVNISKCNFLRVGARCASPCAPILHSNIEFKWVQQIRYLGVYINNAKKFICDFSNARKKFFRAFNAIYSKVGRGDTSALLVSLLCTKCVPILLYGTDATGVDKYELKSLCNSYNRAFMKIFGSFNKTTILQCQWYSYCLDFSHMLDLHRLRFLSQGDVVSRGAEDIAFSSFDPMLRKQNIMSKYNILSSDKFTVMTDKINNHFRDLVFGHN